MPCSAGQLCTAKVDWTVYTPACLLARCLDAWTACRCTRTRTARHMHLLSFVSLLSYACVCVCRAAPSAALLEFQGGCCKDRQCSSRSCCNKQQHRCCSVTAACTAVMAESTRAAGTAGAAAGACTSCATQRSGSQPRAWCWQEASILSGTGRGRCARAWLHCRIHDSARL